jgi:putative phosphoesterase
MTTRVLVTSDTHLTLGARLPDVVLELADRADHVVHAGDLVSLDVLATFEALAPVTAVHGNVCDTETAGRVPERAQVTLDGVTVGVVHDPGPASGRHERLMSWFPGCDVVVYGHTHMPELTRVERPGDVDGTVLVLNPGSPTQRRRAPTHTVAWLELDRGTIVTADLVEL